MGTKHVHDNKGSGVRHGESEPVNIVFDLKSFVKIQVILLFWLSLP